MGILSFSNGVEEDGCVDVVLLGEADVVLRTATQDAASLCWLS